MGHKHKKESKKKRRRSESPEVVELERERRHHKKHHKHREKHLKRKKDEEIVISDDDDLVEIPPPPKISRHSPEVPSPPLAPASGSGSGSGSALARKPLTPPPPPTIKSSSESISIEETNRLRAKLGLKPLEVPSNDVKKEDEKKPKLVMGGTDMGEFVHKPAENIFQKAETEKIKAKIAERKMKREMEAKLAGVKGLADSDEDDDIASWVEKSRKLAIEKERAAKKAKELDDMDAAFGISDLVNDDLRITRKEAYTSRNLQGLRVEHDANNFADGRNIILTLKDKGVLEEGDDALVNVNLLDEERYQKNIFNKKQKPHQFGYNAYDDGEEEDMDIADKVLTKYDEEIAGEKKKSFTIGEENKIDRKKMLVKEKLMAGKRLESLGTTSLSLASDYYTEQEMQVKFKKPKKKVKKSNRRMLKADDLLATDNGSQETEGNWMKDLSSRRRPHVDLKPDPGFEFPGSSGNSSGYIKQESMDMELDTDDLPPVTEDLSKVVVDEPDDFELELALKKARKLKQMENTEVKPEEKIIKIAEQLDHKMAYEESGPGGSIVLNATAEFCRTLGDIPTYGQAGNREEDEQQMLELEQELKEEKLRMEEERNLRGGWNEVDMNNESTSHAAPVEAPILDAEPDLGTGIAGALKLALSKGYLEREVSKRPSASRFSHLQAKNYSIEDKAHVEDDKFSRRERFNGPTTDFKEKDGYKPNIKLDYIDDDGHKLSQKEAFRYLSHKFHGKGPSKNKVEKRMKKNEQDSLMKQMSSTDTPLGTLNMLQAKQKETHSPFVVLSGNKQLQTISKTKF